LRKSTEIPKVVASEIGMRKGKPTGKVKREKGEKNPVLKEELSENPSKFIHEMWMEESRTAYSG